MPLQFESLNDSDVFVADLGTSMYQFNGEFSSGSERGRAAQAINGLIRGRHRHVRKFTLDGIRDKQPCASDFWGLFNLEGAPDRLKREETPPAPQDIKEVTLHRVSGKY